jgi:probable HAF family extracellular repeat protein
MAALLLCAAGTNGLAQPAFQAQEILVNGGPTAAWTLSNGGYVVGNFQYPHDFRQYAFRWHDGAVDLLGSGPWRDAYPISVNSAGNTVGDADNGSAGAAVLWDAQGYHDLGNLGGLSYAEVGAINENGWIVGGTTTTTSYHGFLYRNHQMEDLGSLHPTYSSFAVDLNDAGVVVGYDVHAYLDQVFYYAWSWTDSTGLVPLPFEQPGHLNNAGDLDVGNRIYNIYSGQFRTLPGAYGNLHLSNINETVGEATGGVQSLWLGTSRYNLQDLLEPGNSFTITSTLGINDNGQILVASYDRSFLLTPVPEPGTLPLIALAGFFVRRRCSAKERCIPR